PTGPLTTWPWRATGSKRTSRPRPSSRTTSCSGTPAASAHSRTPKFATSAVDAVEQLPVAAQGALGGCGKLVDVCRSGGDEVRARRGGVLDVALGVQLEVPRARRARLEAVVLHEPAELRVRDGRLGGLDRVEDGERLEAVGRAPGVRTRAGLGGR